MSEQKSIDLMGKPVHFIGVGGIGMSALAYILARCGLPVSGSDLRKTHITSRLEAAGARVFRTQEAANITQFDAPPQVVCSTAIGTNNPEYCAALAAGCSIFHRSDVLASLIADRKQSIAVAGTHGKTTTSSLIGYLLLEGNLDPTIVVGGEVDAWDGNARQGESEVLVAEADESDGTLAKLRPAVGVITNIELDHPDHYDSLDAVVEIFTTFADRCQTVVGCWDCPTVRERIDCDLSYSLDPASGADYIAEEIVYGPDGTQARVREGGRVLGTLHLPLLGQHNLCNALAAIAVARHCGLEWEAIARGLAGFSGAKRRFEYRGQSNGITCIDDYAHHPSEVAVTLEAARLRVGHSGNASNGSTANVNSWPSARRVVAIFQPHRYTRLTAFLEEFSAAFAAADVAIVTDVYAAGETANGITGEHLAEAIRRNHKEVHYHHDLATLPSFLAQVLEPGDLAMFLGAGNLNQSIAPTLDLLGARCAA